MYCNTYSVLYRTLLYVGSAWGFQGLTWYLGSSVIPCRACLQAQHPAS